jgi:hypothetical protein
MSADKMSRVLQFFSPVAAQQLSSELALEAAVIYGKPADDILGALRRWPRSLGLQQDAGARKRYV